MAENLFQMAWFVCMSFTPSLDFRDSRQERQPQRNKRLFPRAISSRQRPRRDSTHDFFETMTAAPGNIVPGVRRLYQRIRVNVIHRKVRDRRNDILHQIFHLMIAKAAVIKFETECQRHDALELGFERRRRRNVPVGDVHRVQGRLGRRVEKIDPGSRPLKPVPNAAASIPT